MAHRGDQDLLRQLHEPLLDPAEQDDRPLDQPRELRHERWIVAQLEPLGSRQPLGFARDLARRSAGSSWT